MLAQHDAGFHQGNACRQRIGALAKGGVDTAVNGGGVLPACLFAHFKIMPQGIQHRQHLQAVWQLRGWAGKVIALDKIRLRLQRNHPFPFGFHAFRHHQRANFLQHGHQPGVQRACLAGLAGVAQQRAVELDDVGLQPPQPVDIGVTSTKIIYGNHTALLLELLQRCHQRIQVVNPVLQHFQHHAIRGQAMGSQPIGKAVNRLRVKQEPFGIGVKKQPAVTEPAKKEEAKKTAAASPAKKAATANNKAVSHTVRVDIDKLDVLMNLVSELIIAKNGLVSASISSDEAATTNNQKFTEQIEYLERVTTNLHESVMKVRMMPIEGVISKFPRMIRDLNKKLNKKMELYITGEETELDKSIVEEIGDPIMHLLRNSADHGLESAEVRAERGKPEVGSIYLNAFQEGNNVVIEVSDDGNGIDIERVKAKAVEKGTVTQEQADAMTEKEAIDLLFRPSFSTSEKITDVSGRGVGLDVVKSKIEALGGDVEVKTKYGEGSTFSIRLPLTLAIIQALMVKLGDEKYAISLGAIETIEDVPVTDIKYIHAKEVINLRGSVIPLIRLRDILDVPGEQEESDTITVVIVRKGDKLAGLVVDSLIGQMEIVIKSLGKYININRMISGATILGDGSVALIIDANTLV